MNERLSGLREENAVLIDKNKELKRINEARSKECSSLAEEIIHLRTELDRVNQEYLKFQKIQQISLDLSGTGHQMNFSLSERKQTTREGFNRNSINSSNTQFFVGNKSTPIRNSNDELKSPLVTLLRNFSSPKVNKENQTKRSASLIPNDKASTFRDIDSSKIFHYADIGPIGTSNSHQGSVWSILNLEKAKIGDKDLNIEGGPNNI